VINRPAAYDFTALSDQDWKDLLCPAPDLLYFGTLFQTSAQNRALTVKLLQTCTSSHKFYDVNLRPDSYTPALVGELLQHATIVKVNEDEAEAISDMFGSRIKSLEHFCRSYKDRFGWHTACVTRGAAGCVLLVGDTFVECNGYPVSVIDTVGAGDAFSAALAHGIVSGWEPSKIADFANRVGALIASRSGATPHWTFEEAAALTRPE
jgi:fructokinase